LSYVVEMLLCRLRVLPKATGQFGAPRELDLCVEPFEIVASEAKVQRKG
jgi:hypothetical protein